MKISVTIFGLDAVIELDVYESQTVDDVKELFYQRTGTDVSQQTLCKVRGQRKNTLFDGSATLESLGVQEGDMFSVVIAGPSAKRRPPDGNEFEITIDRTGGAALGVDVDNADGVTLRVDSVTGGLVGNWNVSHIACKVAAGDRIVAVNGIRGNLEGIVGECKRLQVLKLTFRAGPNLPTAQPAVPKAGVAAVNQWQHAAGSTPSPSGYTAQASVHSGKGMQKNPRQSNREYEKGNSKGRNWGAGSNARVSQKGNGKDKRPAHTAMGQYNSYSVPLTPGQLATSHQLPIPMPPPLEPSSQPAPPRPNNVGFEYVVSLDKSQGGRLGVDVDNEDGVSLLVEAFQDAGLFVDWNTANPDKQVMVDDRIVAVNSARGDVFSLMAECKQHKPLKVTLFRAGPARRVKG